MIPRTPQDIAARGLDGLQLDDHGTPRDVLVLVDLTAPTDESVGQAAADRLARHPTVVAIGLAAGTTPAPTALTEALDCTLTDTPTDLPHAVGVPDLTDALRRIADTIRATPRASVTLCALLRQTTTLDVPAGLAAESAAYSMLLTGPEFRRWQATRPAHPHPPTSEAPVLLRRDGPVLHVTLNRPHRRNAVDSATRDHLAEAFDLPLADPSLARVELHGAGPSFCSGGDLDEFGTAPDPSTAHLIRLDRSVGARIHRCPAPVTAHLHGACVGAGIELPAFAHNVLATPDTVITLPESGMGLIPGAGGTVSLPRRIGRWRTAYLALTRTPLDTATALRWGLIDQVTR